MSPRVVGIVGGGLVDPQAPLVYADDLGLDRGDGCFEGVRVIVDEVGVAVVDKLDAHLSRLARSARALDIPFDESGWRELIARALCAWTLPGESSLRLLLTRGRTVDGPPTGILVLKPAPALFEVQRREGIRVVTLGRGVMSDAFSDSPWLLGGVKTLSYAVNMAAYREAARRGADDVIFVSDDGVVLEAPTAAVIWSIGRSLHTPPVDGSGILTSTTQQRLFVHAQAAGWVTSSTPASVDDLHAADGLWLISTGRGPVDVVELDGKARARDLDLLAEIRALSGF
jgi:4-amino-4-deoxychorismate lyase